MKKDTCGYFGDRQSIANWLGISRNTLRKYESMQPLPHFCTGEHITSMSNIEIQNWINCLIANGMVLKARIRKEALE